MRKKRERWVLLKIPRGDIDGVYNVTVTSERRAQAERANKQKTKRQHPVEA